ncbi:hypothetical protein H5410_046190, partial [Solanum commersonii]
MKSNGYKNLNLNLNEVIRIEKTHFQLGEDELLSSTCLCSGPLGGITSLRGTIRRSADCSFHRLFDPLPSRLCLLKQRVECFPSGILQDATQDSIMNIHNKTQITHEKINCVLKDSSCDTPLLKILMITILATNIRNQIQYSHSERGTQCMFLPIGLPLFSHRSSIRLTQDKKGLFKACNGAECKSM